MLPDPLDQLLPPVLDGADLLPEGFGTAPRATDLVVAGGRAAIAPEEPGAAGLAQLLERLARIREQPVLFALRRQGGELGVDRAQVRHEAVELRAHLGELRQQRLAVLGRCGFHGTPRDCKDG